MVVEEYRYAKKHIVLFVLGALIIWSVMGAGYLALGKPLLGDPTNLTGDKTVVNELAVPPSLQTALDICKDTASVWTLTDQFGFKKEVKGFQVAHFKLDDHFEGQLIQNQGQLNQVYYHLYWRPDPLLQIIIKEARAGTPSMQRTDPHTADFDACIKTKPVEEIVPKS